MEKGNLSEHQKENVIAGIVVLLGVLVIIGQVAEIRSGLFWDMLNYLRLYIDPMQYMIGMLMINFIMVLTAIRRYKLYPNPILNTLKWYFTILYLNDFIILVLRVIQKSNFIIYRGGFTMGLGKTYILLGSVRGIIDVTLTAGATFLLVLGVIKYSTCSETAEINRNRFNQAALGLVAVQWLASVPLNLTGVINSRAVFAWSLGLSQAAQMIVIGFLCWTVKEYHQKYHTRFFRFLTMYYLVSLCVTGLVFTYSMGSFGLLQRFPAGETGVLNGFGQLVFYLSRLSSILMSYLMFRAVAEYAEKPGPAQDAAGICTAAEVHN